MPVFGDDFIKGFYGNKPCPRCSRLTVEGLAKVMFRIQYELAESITNNDLNNCWNAVGELDREEYRSMAQAVLAHLEGKEGKCIGTK